MGTWPEVGSGQGIGEECSQVENGRKIGREQVCVVIFQRGLRLHGGFKVLLPMNPQDC